MGRVLGVEFLPLEVLEVIVTFLSAKDLTLCLGVSRTWYNIFSNDLFWKRHCMNRSSNYLSKAKSLVEPGFKLTPNPILPIQEKRLQFLQEQHLWRNWNCGHFKKEEIEFDCDDSISYNINVSFLDNDHVCLHLTYETEVWNVAETPALVMSVPYCLKELWEANVYKVVEGDLVVIQCNVVQVYKISLESKSWSLNHVFFFNKPEEFSSSITAESDVDDIFQLECSSDFEEVSFERVVCGEYMVGADSNEGYPFLHVWNIKTGKKIKEDKLENIRISTISIKSAKDVANKVLVTYKLKNCTNEGGSGNVGRGSSIIYDLSQMQFLLQSRFDHNGSVLYYDGLLSVIDDNPITIVSHRNVCNKNETNTETSKSLPDSLQSVTSVQPLGSNLLISTSQQIYLVNISKLTTSQHIDIPSLMKVDLELDHLEVLFDRYVLLHEVNFKSIKELWKIDKSCTKVLEFPEDSGTFAALNNACSKIVLERGNKLIILNFW